MPPIPHTSSTDPIAMPVFTDRMVNNAEFFETMEERLSPILSVHEIAANTRRELHELLAQMKKKAFIDGVTEWTAEEQKKFFARVQSEMFRVGNSFRATIQALIEDEILREIDDNGRKMKFKKHRNMELVDGNGNTILSDIQTYQYFLDESFLSQETTSTTPIDLHLTISETETIEEAQKKLNRYHGRYNALILVDTNNRPTGIIQASAFAAHEDREETLENIPRIPEISGNYQTSVEAIQAAMLQYGINIFPIIDSKTGVLIGIVTSRSLVQKELRYHSTVDLTGLRIEMAHPKTHVETR